MELGESINPFNYGDSHEEERKNCGRRKER
jgi:hypothetical protein